MKLKQLIAFVLILLMLLPILCACGDSKGGEESTCEEIVLTHGVGTPLSIGIRKAVLGFQFVATFGGAVNGRVFK